VLAGATTLFGCITNTLQSMPNGSAGNHRTHPPIRTHSGFVPVCVGATKMKTNFGMIADCLSFSLFGTNAASANAGAHLLLPNWK